jgi:hypothetical protein
MQARVQAVRSADVECSKVGAPFAQFRHCTDFSVVMAGCMVSGRVYGWNVVPCLS